MGMSRWFLALLLAGGMFMSAPALASESSDEKAKEWCESGKAFYHEARYEQALVAFETAYRLSSRPTLLRSIGYCYEKLDRLEEALDTFHRWLGQADPENLTEIERHIRRIEQAIDAANQVAPPPPLPPPTVVVQPQQAPTARKEWRMGTGPAVLYGVSGIGAVTGVVFAVQADQARKAAAALCSTGDAVFCTGAASNSISRDRTFSGIADLSFGLGGAALVTGTLWMVIGNTKNTAVRVAPVGKGMGLMGTF